jgi:hypothetical protein
MVHALSDYLEKQGVKVVEASLRRVVGKAAPFVREEAHFRQSVIQPGWEALPPPVRLMMRRQFPRWDAFYLALRDQVFDLRGGSVGLKADAPARVATLMKRFFGERPEGSAAESDRLWRHRSPARTTRPWPRRSGPAPMRNAEYGMRNQRQIPA